MANGPSPTVEELQLRKRARRRLIGAVTLVAVLVTVLPMVLDDEPKPVGQDIAINIPSQQSADFPLKAAPPPRQDVQLSPPPALPPAVPVKSEKPAQPDKAVPVTPAKPAEAKPVAPAVHKEEKSAEKPKPAVEKPKESKPADKPKDVKPASKASETPPGAGSHVILLGAFLSEANSKQRQARLKELGVKFYLEKINSPGGVKTAVRAGPYASREEAERVLARLKAAGVTDGLVAEKK